jgi:hypothetical protein
LVTKKNVLYHRHLAGDGNVLFKIIPVETNGAPLYQIVPTTSTIPDSRPVVTYPQATPNTVYKTYNTAATATQTYSQTPTTSTVHQVAEIYTPSQPAPTVTYTSQVSHPLPPPQQQLAVEKPTEEKSDIFKKVLTNIDPRTRTGRKTDADAAESHSAETVFYMSAPDMSKEAPRSTPESEVVVLVSVL